MGTKRSMRMLAALAILALMPARDGARAGDAAPQETVTLDVEGMTCAMCPITVRKALERVPGVMRVEAEYEGEGRGWARVPSIRPAPGSRT